MNVFPWFTLHVDALMGWLGIGKNLVSFFTRKTLITFLPKAGLALRSTNLTVTSNLT